MYVKLVRSGNTFTRTICLLPEHQEVGDRLLVRKRSRWVVRILCRVSSESE